MRDWESLRHIECNKKKCNRNIKFDIDLFYY